MKCKSIWGGNTATYTQLGGKNTELFLLSAVSNKVYLNR